jgi:uncharacterized membrane protein
MINPDTTASAEEPGNETWHFRGYAMRPGEFYTAMVDLYRGEVSRSNTWRTRLDWTSNWAVVTIAALLTFSFGDTNNHHVVLLLAIFLNLTFLFIEARRYRYYELWSLRVRLMETDFFAAMLAPPFGPSKDWARQLNESLLTPQFPISLTEALGRRLRRNYLGIFLLILVSWITKLLIHPIPLEHYTQFVERAAVGPIPGQVVIASITTFYVILLLGGLFTSGLHDSPSEVLPRYGIFEISGNLWAKLWPVRPKKHLIFIITSQDRAVADQLLNLLKRGVTSLQGKGMYTGEARTVLLCAVEATDIAHLKSLVYAVDPEAFIVVNPAHDIIGRNFSQLK